MSTQGPDVESTQSVRESVAPQSEQSHQPAGGGQGSRDAVRAQLRGLDYEDGSALVSPHEEPGKQRGGPADTPGGAGKQTPSAVAQIGEYQDPAATDDGAMAKGGLGEARDLLTRGIRRERIAEQAADIPSQDVIYEQLAHRFAYDDSPDAAALREFGYSYRRGENINDSQTDLQVFLFRPIPDLVAEMTRKQGRPPRAVVAFRGTSSAADVEDDANTEGIGMFQFSANEPAIGALMGQAAPVDLVGHSLGGALAQIAATRFAGLTNRVVTFQAPGIRLEDVQNLQRQNADMPADRRVTATHYRTAGDVVPLGGEQHIDGTVHNVSYTGVPTPASHMSYPLANIENLRGGEYANQLRDGDDELIENSAVDSVGTRRHRGRGTQATEGARVFAGEVRDHGTGSVRGINPYSPGPLIGARIDPNVSNFQGDDYARAWEAARSQAQAGVPLATILAALAAAPNVDETMRARLVANMNRMYASLAPAQKAN